MLNRRLKDVLCGNGPTFPLFRSRSNPEVIDYDLTKLHIEKCLIESGYGCGEAGVHFGKVGGYTAFTDQMLKKVQMDAYEIIIPFIKKICEEHAPDSFFPVLANISSNEPGVAVRLAEVALASGADILVATPTYNTNLRTRDILMPVKDAYPDAKIILHVSEHFEPMEAKKIVELAKNGLINGVIWSFEQHSLRQLVNIVHNNNKYQKNETEQGEMPEDFVFGTDTESYMMVLTVEGGRFCVSRSANLYPIMTNMLTQMHENVRNNNYLSTIKELDSVKSLIHRVEKDSPRNLLYMLCMMHPDIYGETPVLPPNVPALEERHIEKIRQTLADYNLLPILLNDPKDTISAAYSRKEGLE